MTSCGAPSARLMKPCALYVPLLPNFQSRVATAVYVIS